MDATNKRRMQPFVLAAAATLTAGPTQAETGVDPAKANLNEYAPPVLCHQDDEGGHISNPVQVVDRGHYPSLMPSGTTTPRAGACPTTSVSSGRTRWAAGKNSGGRMAPYWPGRQPPEP